MDRDEVMPKFSKLSKERLATAHPDLQRLFNEVIKDVDCTVLYGHRGKKEQDDAYARGNSGLQWPNSKHNKKPSLAVDVVPWPVNWNDLESFVRLSRIVKLKAKLLGIPIVWGGDWKKLVDMPHYELKQEKTK